MTRLSEGCLCVLAGSPGQQHNSVICLGSVRSWNSDFQKILKPPPFWTALGNPWKVLPFGDPVYLLSGRTFKGQPDMEIFFRYCNFLKVIIWERFWWTKIINLFQNMSILNLLLNGFHVPCVSFTGGKREKNLKSFSYSKFCFFILSQIHLSLAVWFGLEVSFLSALEHGDRQHVCIMLSRSTFTHFLAM